VQVDRRAKTIRDAAGVRAKFGVEPALIPDFLALVGDAADGYPGITGIGAVGAARLLNHHGPIEAFPPEVLGERREQALRCSSSSQRCAAMRRCSTPWTNCNGEDRPTGSLLCCGEWTPR
jgi:5'-3' exonuclease